MPATFHAAVRMQQRAIPAAATDLLLDHGTRSRGADKFFFDRAARRQAQHELGLAAIRRVARYLNAYAVIGDDGALITVAWRTRRIRRA
jgi:hypothetical protein